MLSGAVEPTEPFYRQIRDQIPSRPQGTEKGLGVILYNANGCTFFFVLFVPLWFKKDEQQRHKGHKGDTKEKR